MAHPLDPLAGDTGLGRWTLANRSIENTDVVLWLKPFGFFDRNPSLDVVATPPDMCHTPSTSAHH